MGACLGVFVDLKGAAHLEASMVTAVSIIFKTL
jgi:hypothetical protein